MEFKMRYTYKVIISFILFIIYSNLWAQECSDTIAKTTPTNRFELQGSEAKDLRTGLIWQRCSLGEQWDGVTCTGVAETYSWERALSQGDEEWRLPNIKELQSIVESSCFYPSYNIEVFPERNKDPIVYIEGYWTSSSDIRDPYIAWKVSFVSGGIFRFYSTKYSAGLVRLVRNGP